MARAKRYCYAYPRAMVTVDAVVFRVRGRERELLLIRRKAAPYKNFWALPGGFIKIKETLEESVVRELGEETGLKNVSSLRQLGTYGDPGRDPRGRVVSVAFVGLVSSIDSEVKGGDDAAAAAWFRITKLPEKLAFDHATIIADALQRLAAGNERMHLTTKRTKNTKKSANPFL